MYLVKYEPYAVLIGDLQTIRIHNATVSYKSSSQIDDRVYELNQFSAMTRTQQEKYLIYKLGRARFDGENAFFLRSLVEQYIKKNPTEKLTFRLKEMDKEWTKHYFESLGGQRELFNHNLTNFVSGK